MDIVRKQPIVLAERFYGLGEIIQRVFHPVGIILYEIPGLRIRRLVHRFDCRQGPQNPIWLDRVQGWTGNPCRVLNIVAQPAQCMRNHQVIMDGIELIEGDAPMTEQVEQSMAFVIELKTSGQEDGGGRIRPLLPWP
jgi:hypothetical protein